MSEQHTTDLFRPHLFAGEHLLWTGRPKQGLVFTGKDALLVPFSLMWGGFAIFWNVGVWTIPSSEEGTSWFMRLWGLPFLLIGLYVIFGRFLHDAAIRKRSAYGVTNQRVLVLRGLGLSKLTSLDINRLPRLGLSEHRDGTGTLAFEASSMFSSTTMNGFGWWVPSLSGAVQFFRIGNPRQVLETIRRQAALLS